MLDLIKAEKYSISTDDGASSSEEIAGLGKVLGELG
jgi:hypothetical protein